MISTTCVCLTRWHFVKCIFKKGNHPFLSWMNCNPSLIEAVAVKRPSGNYLQNQPGSESTHQAAVRQEFLLEWIAPKKFHNKVALLFKASNGIVKIMYLTSSKSQKIRRAMQLGPLMPPRIQDTHDRPIMISILLLVFVLKQGFSTDVELLCSPFPTLSLSFVPRQPPHIHVMFLLKQTASHLLLH